MLDLSKLPSKFLLFTFLTLFFVPMVMAVDTITIPYNQDYDLKRSCLNNGTYCSSSAVCNVTIVYPNGQIFLDNALMTNQVSFHNKSLGASELQQFGNYPSTMVCFDSGGDVVGNGANSFFLKVTADGDDSFPFPFQFSIILLGVVFIGMAKFNDRLLLFQTIGSIILLVMGVVTLYPGYSNFNYSNLAGQVIGFSTVGLGFWFMIENAFSRNEQADSYDLYYEEDE